MSYKGIQVFLGNIDDIEEAEEEKDGPDSEVKLIDTSGQNRNRVNKEVIKEQHVEFDGPIEILSEPDVAIEVDDIKNEVLVVDDESFNIIVIRNQFKKLGLGCNSSLSPAKVLELVSERIEKAKQGEAEMYKLLLIDYSMPEIDGIMLIKQLRELIVENGLPHPTYCCCTAYTSKEHHDIAIASGFHVFMTKPATVERMRQLVHQAFGVEP